MVKINEVAGITEAEFENNTPLNAGGLLLCVVKTGSVAGTIGLSDIYNAGLSNTGNVPFCRGRGRSGSI